MSQKYEKIYFSPRNEADVRSTSNLHCYHTSKLNQKKITQIQNLIAINLVHFSWVHKMDKQQYKRTRKCVIGTDDRHVISIQSKS